MLATQPISIQGVIWYETYPNLTATVVASVVSTKDCLIVLKGVIDLLGGFFQGFLNCYTTNIQNGSLIFNSLTRLNKIKE